MGTWLLMDTYHWLEFAERGTCMSSWQLCAGCHIIDPNDQVPPAKMSFTFASFLCPRVRVAQKLDYLGCLAKCWQNGGKKNVKIQAASACMLMGQDVLLHPSPRYARTYSIFFPCCCRVHPIFATTPDEPPGRAPQCVQLDRHAFSYLSVSLWPCLRDHSRDARGEGQDGGNFPEGVYERELGKLTKDQRFMQSLPRLDSPPKFYHIRPLDSAASFLVHGCFSCGRRILRLCSSQPDEDALQAVQVSHGRDRDTSGCSYWRGGPCRSPFHPYDHVIGPSAVAAAAAAAAQSPQPSSTAAAAAAVHFLSRRQYSSAQMRRQTSEVENTIPLTTTFYKRMCKKQPSGQSAAAAAAAAAAIGTGSLGGPGNGGGGVGNNSPGCGGAIGVPHQRRSDPDHTRRKVRQHCFSYIWALNVPSRHSCPGILHTWRGNGDAECVKFVPRCGFTVHPWF